MNINLDYIFIYFINTGLFFLVIIGSRVIPSQIVTALVKKKEFAMLDLEDLMIENISVVKYTIQ